MKTLVALLILLVAPLAWSCQKVGVKGMTCTSCVKKVEAAFKAHPEVETVQVDLKKGTVQLHYKAGKSLTDEQVKSTIEQAGFELEVAKKKSSISS